MEENGKEGMRMDEEVGKRRMKSVMGVVIMKGKRDAERYREGH